MKLNITGLFTNKKRTARAPKTRKLRLEGLETRELLSVSSGFEFETPGALGESGYIASRFTTEEAIAAYLARERTTNDGVEINYEIVKLDESSTLIQDAQEAGAPDVYYDADKSAFNTQDDLLCWAATSANMLWHTGWASVSGLANEQEFFDSAFVGTWPDQGGNSETGCSWYLNDEYLSLLKWWNSTSTWAEIGDVTDISVDGGGAYSTLFSIYGETARDYVSATPILGVSDISTIAENIRAGAGVGLSIDCDGESGHSITCWGYAVNENLSENDPGYYTGLYVTDSDDEKANKNDDLLNERELFFLDLTWDSDVETFYGTGTYRISAPEKGYQTGSDGYYLYKASFLAQRPEKYALDSSETETPSIIVTTNLDVADPTDNKISLREALAYAQAGDTITFDASLKGSTIVLNKELKVKKAVTIDASALRNADDAPGLTLDGNGATRIVSVSAAASFAGLAFTNGSAENGGAIYATAGLTVDDCVFTNNATTKYGGAIRAENADITITNSTFASNSSTSEGGAIKTDGGSITFVDVNFIGNSSAYGGAMQAYRPATATITGGTYSGNTARYGGAIHFNSALNEPLSVSLATFSENTASYSGGAIFTVGSGTAMVDQTNFTGNVASSWGGAITNKSALTVTNSHFEKNSTTSYGGGAINADAQASVSNSEFVSNSAGSDGGAIRATAALTVSNDVFASNTATNDGGAIYLSAVALSATDSTFAQNVATNGDGGAIRLGNGNAPISLTRVSLTSNTAGDEGGALKGDWGEYAFVDVDFIGNSARNGGAAQIWWAQAFSYIGGMIAYNVASYDGGAFYYSCPTNVTSTLEDLEFKGNSAINHCGGAWYTNGGAHVATNTTWSDNKAWQGGAFYAIWQSAPATFNSNTFANNTASQYGGAAYSAWAPFTFNDVNFTGDSADTAGGAIYLAEDATATVTGGSIANCWSPSGAGIYVAASSTATINGTTISNPLQSGKNVRYGGAIYAVGTVTATNAQIVGNYAEEGAGVYVNGENAIVTLVDSSVRENCGRSGYYSYGGGAYVSHGKLIASGGEFCDNGDRNYCNGGALYVEASGEATLEGALVQRNRAYYGCGGGVLSAGTFSATNCVFASNEADDGGGVYISDGVTNLVNVTITGNIGERRGGGLYSSNSSAVVTVENSIIATNEANKANLSASGSADVDIPNGTGTARNVLSSFTDWSDGENVYAYDASLPLFVNAAEGDYALASDSVAINAGDASYLAEGTTTDVVGAPRIVHVVVDLGAYEYQGANYFLATPKVAASNTESTITLRWTTVPNADGYEIAYSTDGANFETVSVAANVADYAFENLALGATLYLKARALGADVYAIPSDYSPTVVRSTTLPDAPSLVVTTTEDVVDPLDGKISLREAISYAADAALGDTITFDATLNNATITLDGEELLLDRSLKIDASALDSLTIDAAKRSRVIEITDSDTTDDVPVAIELIGLTITGGYGEDNNQPDLYGAGVYVNGASATLADCVVTGNVGRFGGGIYIGTSSATSNFVNCTIIGNTAVRGGGAYVGGGQANFENCVVSDNVATSEGFDASGNDSGYCNQTWGGGLCITQFTTLTNCTISNNHADASNRYDHGDGGGIYGGCVLMANCVVSGNTARTSAGINAVGTSYFSAINCLIVDNTATETYGGIGNARGIITNCTISGNKAKVCPGLHSNIYKAEEVARNSIIVGNTTIYGEESDFYGYGILHTSLVGTGTFLDEQDETLYFCDPTQTIFTDAANGDYSLASNSLAIDVGNSEYLVGAVPSLIASFVDQLVGPELAQLWSEGPETDIAGNPRATLGSVDLGAYEYQGASYQLAAPTIIGYETEAGTISFEWSSVPYAKKYYISYALEGGAATTLSAPADVSSYTLTGLEPNGTYQIKIRATSASSYATASGWSTVKTIVARDPEAPSLVVTTLDDVVDKYDDLISLREALAYAEANPTLGDTITFAASLDGGTIALAKETYLTVSTPIAIDASALGSLAVDAGGAYNVFDLNAENVSLKGLTITGATSYGVFIDGDNASLVDCKIIDNQAGVFIRGTNATLSGCEISDNSSDGVYASYNAKLVGCVIVNNGASGVYTSSSDTTLVNCVISSNGHGGVYINGRSATLVNCLISENAYSGIYMSSYTNATLVNCTVVGNKTTSSSGAGGIIVAYSSNSSKLALYNTIVANNVGGDIKKSTSSSDSASIVGYNTLSTFTAWDDGSNNYLYDSTSLLFNDAANGDYTLAEGSVAIDAGNAEYLPTDVATDLAGTPRVSGDGVDLGVYEFSPKAAPLDAPTLTVSSKKETAITVKWTAVDGAVGYVFEYKAEDAEEYVVVNLAANKSQRQISGLTPGVRYDIRIKAVAGEGAVDSEYAEITTAPQVVLTTPVVALTNADETSLSFAWDAVEGAVGYKVMYIGAGESAYTTLTLDATTSVTLTGLQAAASYSVKVCALGDGLDYKSSPYSTLTAYKTVNPFQLLPPTLVASAASNDSLLIRWDAIPNSTKYYISYAPVGSKTFTSKSTPAKNLYYRIQGLEPNTDYQVRLRAIASGEYVNSGYSAVTVLTTSTEPFATTTLEVPTVAVSAATSGSLLVEWESNPLAIGYTIIYKLKTDSSYTTVKVGASETSLLLEGLTPGATYYAKVSATGDGTFYKNSGYCATKVALLPQETTEALLDEAFAELFEDDLLF